MKNAHILLPLLAILPFLCEAQPVITSGTLIKPGDALKIQEALIIPDPGPAGADVMWDFSNLELDTLIFDVEVVDPATTPFAASFPTATACEKITFEEFEDYIYFEVTQNSFTELGSGVPGISEETLTDTREFLELPLMFGNTNNDTYRGTESFDIGINTDFNGNLSTEIDAWGTLVLPQGMFDEVLRIKIIDDEVDTTTLGAGLSEKNLRKEITYIWISAAHPEALCSYTIAEQTMIGIFTSTNPDTVIVDTMFFDPDTSFSFDPSATSSAIRFVDPETFAFSAIPNPFTEFVDVAFNIEEPAEVIFELREISGKSMFTEKFSAARGENTYNMRSLRTVPPGAYLLILKYGNQGSAIKVMKTE